MKRNEKEIKKIVKEGYAKVAKQGISCCASGSCCSPSSLTKNISKTIGYSDEEMNAVPEGANLGLGCGNPIAMASLKQGEVVLDLGSGAGFDAFLAAKRVGKAGRVIGVDMTPEMIKKAGENAKKGSYKNIEIAGESNYPVEIMANNEDLQNAARAVVSIKISAVKGQKAKGAK
ncbi:MAG: methyltransferase domain-containing protein [Candidatus Omnitrophota bacterium]